MALWKKKRLKTSNGLNHLIFIYEGFDINIYVLILIFHTPLCAIPEYTNTG